MTEKTVLEKKRSKEITVRVPADVYKQLQDDGYVRRLELWTTTSGKFQVKRAIWERD